MIQELREYSQSLFFKLLLLVIAVTLVISFGVGSFFGERKEVLATVNGQDVLLKDFQRAYQNQMENLRRTFGDSADKLDQLHQTWRATRGTRPPDGQTPRP